MKARLYGRVLGLREEGAAMMEHDGGLSRQDAEGETAKRMHLPACLGNPR